MDEVDRAQEAEDRILAATLASRARPGGLATIDCERCDEEIPAARRAVIETRYCVDCQSALERMAQR